MAGDDGTDTTGDIVEGVCPGHTRYSFRGKTEMLNDRGLRSFLGVALVVMVASFALFGFFAAAVQQQADWAETSASEPSFIQNKPDIPPDARVEDLQADWNEMDPDSLQFIQGRPTRFGTVFQGSYPSGDTTSVNLSAGDIIEVDDGFYITLATVTIEAGNVPTDNTNFHRIDTSGTGLSSTQVNALISSGVQDWAEAGNTTIIPDAKLPTPVPTQSPASIATAIAALK